MEAGGGGGEERREAVILSRLRSFLLLLLLLLTMMNMYGDGGGDIFAFFFLATWLCGPCLQGGFNLLEGLLVMHTSIRPPPHLPSSPIFLPCSRAPPPFGVRLGTQTAYFRYHYLSLSVPSSPFYHFGAVDPFCLFLLVSLCLPSLSSVAGPPFQVTPKKRRPLPGYEKKKGRGEKRETENQEEKKED